VIRFSAALVVVAIGVLIGGVATSKLTLIYLAIAIIAAALVTLAVGVALKREELFGEGRALSPAEAGGSVGLPVSAAAEHDRHDQVQHGGSAAPHLEPFPGLAAAPLGQPLFGAAVISSDTGRPDGPARTAFGPPVPGQPAFGPPAFGQNPATNPWPTADNPWPTADAAVASGWSGAEPSAPATPRAGDLGRPPWDVSGGETQKKLKKE